MVLKLYNSLRHALAAIIPAIQRNTRGSATPSVVHRRVEVTVERETVTVLVPLQPPEGSCGTARGHSTGTAAHSPSCELEESQTTNEIQTDQSNFGQRSETHGRTCG